MGKFLTILITLSVAIITGFGLSFYALSDGNLMGAYRIGQWRAWPQIGTPSPGPYTRAYLARNGIMQLGSAEGLNFIATLDDTGTRLDAACTYSLSGLVPSAVFWTLRAEDSKNRNIAASNSALFLHSESIARGENGSANIAIGPHFSSGNWLETSGTGPITLILNLYDPALLTGTKNSQVEMPRITRETC